MLVVSEQTGIELLGIDPQFGKRIPDCYLIVRAIVRLPGIPTIASSKGSRTSPLLEGIFNDVSPNGSFGLLFKSCGFGTRPSDPEPVFPPFVAGTGSNPVLDEGGKFVVAPGLVL